MATEHPVYMGPIHCCGCLAGAPHSQFDGSGCEWCDLTVIINVTKDNDIVLTRAIDTTPELRFHLEVK